MLLHPSSTILLHGCLMAFHLTRRSRIVASTAAFFLLISLANAQERRLYTPPPLDSVWAIPAEHGMVVAQEKIATQVGADILRRGGNAVDAAVATGFALAVTYPRAGNIGDGFVVADDMADTLPDMYRRMARWPNSAKSFSKADGSPLRDGDRLIQADLAATLTAIAEQGPRGFYDGPVAEKLAKAVGDAGGIMTSDDLKSYSAILRAPVRGNYRGYDIVSMPLPSSGGTVLVEILNILEGFPLDNMKQGSAESLHLMVEAMKRAYADRARYLGDPAFVDAPTTILIAKDYAAKQRATIDPAQATPWAEASPKTPPREGSNTTHYSVVDSRGNAVSNTYTLNFPYGVGLVAEGTGVLLNNELDDFTAAPGAANAFGLVGFEPNLPGPGKRPLSSMSPTIVLKNGKPVLVTGTPGGSRIISAVAQVIINTIDYKMSVAAAVAAPRVHHQWMPDDVRAERGFPQDVLDALKAKGHKVVDTLGQTSANSIAVSPNGPLGAPDPRTRGAWAEGQ